MLSLLPRTLLLPPVGLLLPALLGLLLLRRHPRTARLLLWTSLLTLAALATPAVARLLIAPLETGIRLDLAPLSSPGTPQSGAPQPGAIVILSGDGSLGATEGAILNGARLGGLTLERVWAGAALHDRTGLPILVTGGLFQDGQPALATMMAETLRSAFHIETRWIEDRSVDTWQNAEFSAEILKRAGITSVYVVSHSWHLRRAQMAFAHFGIAMTPAPLDRERYDGFASRDLVPRSSAWLDSYFAIHEWIGCAVYALRS